jgi:hypothetical protein
MKILTDEKFAALDTKVKNYDIVVQAIVDMSDGVTEEGVTPEMIVEAITEKDNADVTEIQGKLDTVTTERDTLKNQVVTLTQEVADLKKIPAAPSATVTQTSDVNSTTETLAAFADKNAGNTAAILKMAQEEGLI